MMQTKKRKWKRRLVVTASVLVVMTGAVVYFAFSRFHFSTQTTWPLPQLQWDHQGNVEFEGVRPQIIGHRGSGLQSSDRGLLIGNTYRAIEKGIQDGVDWIEIDVRKSETGELVVFHDKAIDLKTDRQGLVAELSLDQLQAVNVKVVPPEQILSLDEVFAEFHTDKRKWILDIKAKGIQEQVLAWLDDKVSNGEILTDHLIIFGEFEVLEDYKHSIYSLGYTAIWQNVWNRTRVLFTPSEIITPCKDLDCDYLVLPVIFANPSLVGEAKSAGLDVWVYGVDGARDISHLAGRGVSGFIVDNSEDANKLFGNDDTE
jgi:glycerophosphoryl diester phosphodiesterase